ncbi:MAG: lipopolysaccharide assembly protein LapB [Proteobacteria bacterium]|nr:lipopolysaccharide assembly protein LapB [Pseudomonadota bacterium]
MPPPLLHYLLIALLPIAAFSGWYAGRRGGAVQSGHRMRRLSSTYFRGLNYLLNEQPDKAIELFLQLAEAEKDTVETQFSLGYLFRRRGEVDRAIRLHQGLIARSGLSEEQRKYAMLELGEDYMRAGLLDRAETLFSDLVQADVSVPQALRHLISIYQSERDWDKAIAHARSFEEATGEPMGPLIAHFQCELAEQARMQGDTETARARIADAYVADPHSTRAGILEGQLDLAAGNDAAAIRAFERVPRQDIDYLPAVLKPLLEAYQRGHDSIRARAFLAEMVERYPGFSPVLALSRIVHEEEGVEAARRFVSRQVRQRPSIRGQAAMIDLSLDDPAEAPATLATLKQISDHLLLSSPAFRCGRCGFRARAHHWQCPSCKNWGTIKPQYNLLGE